MLHGERAALKQRQADCGEKVQLGQKSFIRLTKSEFQLFSELLTELLAKAICNLACNPLCCFVSHLAKIVFMVLLFILSEPTKEEAW